VTIGEPAADIEPLLAAGEPYRPDSVADGGTVFGLTVRAASVRGLLKRYAGTARQDDLCLRIHPGTRTLIVAVADGVSAAPRSDLGAALAVRHATAAVARQLERGEVEWDEVFEHAAWALVDEHRRAGGAPDATVEEAAAAMATTLTVATVSADDPAHVRVAAAGDSPALLLRDANFTPLAAGGAGGAGGAGEALIGGSVPALPRQTRPLSTAECELPPDGVLLLCSDGLALPLGDGRGEVGAVFARELATLPEVLDFARLLDFSRSTYDDDRTLVAVWPMRH